MKRSALIGFFVLISFFSLFSGLDAANINAIVQKARTQQGSKTIICSPNGEKEGTVSLEEGLKELRSGMVLHLTPGYYNPKEPVILEQNNIIVESDGSDNVCYLPLTVYGKDCVIRKINVRWIEAGDVVIVDSKTNWGGITISNGGKKVEAVIFNTITHGMSIYADKSDITIAESTILRAYEPKEGGEVEAAWRYNTHVRGVYNIINFGKMEKKGNVTFERCILYSGSNIFSVPANGKMIEITLDNNIIYAKKGIAATKEKSVNDLKDLNDFFGVKLKGDNIHKQPTFLKELNVKADWQLYTDTLTLAASSPGYGKNIGANMGPKNMPVPRENATPEKKK